MAGHQVQEERRHADQPAQLPAIGTPAESAEIVENAATSDFSPFLSTLDDAVTHAARQVLGIPAGIDVKVRADTSTSRSGNRVAVGLQGLAGETLGLLIHRDGDGQRWREDGTGAGLSYQLRDDGADPWRDQEIRPFLAAMAARFTGGLDGSDPDGSDPDGSDPDGSDPDGSDPGASGRIESLWGAVDERARFTGQDDWMYRQINGSGVDLVGNLRLGFRCNQDCGFCWQDRAWPEPPPHLYLQWLDEMAARGLRSLAITGGEPTLHPALPTLIQRAEQVHQISVSLQTNAVLLAKPSRMKKLVDAGLRSIFVSLHSHVGGISDAITRAPGTHKMTIRGVQAALEAGLDVHINCVVERRNAHNLGQFASWLVTTWVTDQANPVAAVTFSEPCRSHDAAQFEAVALPYDEVRGPLTDALAVLADAGVRTFALSTCGFAPCMLTEHPQLLHRQLAAAARPEATDDTDQAGRTFLPVCETCAVRSRCLGIRREYAQLHGSRGLLPVPASV